MSGSKKGRKLRPYHGRYTPVHVLYLTEQQKADDAFEALPSTAQLLDMPIDAPPSLSQQESE